MKIPLATTLLLPALILITAAFPVSAVYSRASLQMSENKGRSAQPLQPIIVRSLHSDTSPALRDIVGPQPSTRSQSVAPLRRGNGRAIGGQAPIHSVDPVVQRISANALMPSPTITFEGTNNRNNVSPPDPNGAVGPNYFVQLVNFQFAVYSKTTGVAVYGPVNLNTVWSGFGGYCQLTDSGDPIVLYDRLADRWLLSQFSLPSNTGPFSECVAVSTTPDPAGSYYRYVFQMPAVQGYPNGKMNDYPKLATWPDAYYMSVNEFPDLSSPVQVGAGVWALNRAQMLAGVPSATSVFFDLYGADPRFGNLLPADVDGRLLPPASAPGYFMSVGNSDLTDPKNLLRIWKFHVDWNTLANSTFGLSGQPNTTLSVAAYNYLPCVLSTACISQPGTTEKVDSVGDRLMHRLAYRNFGDHESLVTNHTVDAGGGVAGVRWFEVRDPGGSPTIYQQGTYSPDTASRWMGSMAMDRDGNIAIGYSVSSSSVYPSIRYAGRLANDPLGGLSQGEAVLINGGGSQLSINQRWGDYSAMTVDPNDDCTFWYTSEYYASTSDQSWETRIGAFRFPTCGPKILTGIISDAVTSLPISGAPVFATLGTSVVTDTQTGVDGRYSLSLSVGTYTVTASAPGYQPAIVGGVIITAATPVTRNFALGALPVFTVSGVITDIVSGTPLTATVEVTTGPAGPALAPALTMPDGSYSLTLFGGSAYTLTATTQFHATQSRNIGVLDSDQVQNFALWPQLWLVQVFRQ